MIERLLAEAQRLYFRSEAGIAALPVASRPAIFAARLIYGEIGARVRANGCDSVTRRAYTRGHRKLALGGAAVARAGIVSFLPRSAVLHAPPLPETAFLVEAARRGSAEPARVDHLTAIFADLRRRDFERLDALRARV